MKINKINRLTVVIALLLVIMQSSLAMTGNQPHKELTLKTTGVIEMVVYTTKDGVSQSEHLKRSEKAGHALAEMDGFVGRHFTRGADGKWIDLVYWRDLEAAQRAADVFVTLPESQGFMADMNDSDMQFIHTSVLSTITSQP
ncbi:MAG: hypothetical protein Q8R24_04475 [Legionellaceae bacterium]|nr:hypothetical protein [Legionellaceae bacterium]